MSITLDGIHHEAPMPTARSPGMLLHMLGIYPILESILSTGHRCEIVNLARTCRVLHFTLTTTVGRLQKPFPSCTKDLQPCILCNTLVCEHCREDTMEQELPGEMLSRMNLSFALLGGNTPTSRGEISTRLQEPRNVHTCTLVQHIRHNYFCEVCFYKPRATMGKSISHNKPEWYWESRVREETGLNNAVSGIRFLRIPYLVWDDVPNGDSTCICAMFETGCQISPHIVRVENLPIESEWAGLVVETTTEFRSKMFGLSGTSHLNSYGLFRIPFYVMD
ncbi:hypothetical protein BGX38DRAFT_1223976 [Terfezia claveryi]|nr:hypothetical protein BGX38DRAFT_1223976 [Terfezia claveryi]